MNLHLIDHTAEFAAGLDSDVWVESCIDCGSGDTFGHARCNRCDD